MIQQFRRFLPYFIGRSTSCRSIIFLMLLAFVIVGWPALPSAQQICQPTGDVTQDGVLTTADALQVLQQALGLSDPPLQYFGQFSSSAMGDWLHSHKDPGTEGLNFSKLYPWAKCREIRSSRCWLKVWPHHTAHSKPLAGLHHFADALPVCSG